MSTPPVPPDPPDDLDPTGIRALLGGLPDPGPMPADLVDRINASIAREESSRGARPVVVPLRRRSVWPKVLVAAAAVAVVGLGVPALLDTGGSTSDSAASFAESGQRDAGGDDASGGAPVAPSPTGLSGPASTARPDTRSADRSGVVSLQSSGTAYTTTALAVQARRTTAAGASKGTGSSARAATGPADTGEGLRDCLRALGVQDWQPVSGDVATFDGQPAVVAVVDSDTGQVAWVVAPDCTAATPRALAGPVSLD